MRPALLVLLPCFEAKRGRAHGVEISSPGTEPRQGIRRAWQRSADVKTQRSACTIAAVGRSPQHQNTHHRTTVEFDPFNGGLGFKSAGNTP
jgi:hypothetical protein